MQSGQEQPLQRGMVPTVEEVEQELAQIGSWETLDPLTFGVVRLIFPSVAPLLLYNALFKDERK